MLKAGLVSTFMLNAPKTSQDMQSVGCHVFPVRPCPRDSWAELARLLLCKSQRHNVPPPCGPSSLAAALSRVVELHRRSERSVESQP